jgi:hypothetical protein
MARGPNILCTRLISGKSQQLILDVGHRRLTQQLRGVGGGMKKARFGCGTPRTECRDHGVRGYGRVGKGMDGSKARTARVRG